MNFSEKRLSMQVFRQIESGVIFIFLLGALFLGFSIPPAISTPAVDQEQGEILAMASAMPSQGWTPLQVYFSAFGSHSENSRIIKYEWDLDSNGIFDTDATAQGGYTSYTYAKPGQYLVTLKITDEQGETALDTILIDARHPASSSVDYWTIFDNNQVQRVEISLLQDDWDSIWIDPEAKLEVPADVNLFGEELIDVGFRMRGQFSLRESGQKKPWKINTDAYLAEQEFHNLRQIMFLNNIGDPSLLQEKLAYDLMQFAGAPASQVCFVELWIDVSDDEQDAFFWGVYSMVERVDRKYISNRFGRDAADGNLYKASHAQRGPMDLVYYGDKIEDYPTQNGLYAYGKTNNEEEADYSDIIELTRVISGTAYSTDEEFMNALEEVLNVDSFLRYMAVIALTMNWDSYPYTGNNFYLFNNPLTGKFEWIPWDLNWGGDSKMALFEREDFTISPYAPLFEKVLAVEDYRRQYAAYLDLLIREKFNETDIYALAENYHQLIKPYMTQGEGDKMFFGETAWFTIQDFENNWTELPELARQRSEYVLQQIEIYR